MKFILVTVLLVSVPMASQANFSGIVYNESPTAPLESMVQDILSDSNIAEGLSSHPNDLKNLKEALLKGCEDDRSVLLDLMKIRNKVLSQVKNLSPEERQKVYSNSVAYIKTAALEFGYKKQTD